MYISHKLHDAWRGGRKQEAIKELLTLPAPEIALVAIELSSYMRGYDERQEFETALRSAVRFPGAP
jgi:hypothetical protein